MKKISIKVLRIFLLFSTGLLIMISFFQEKLIFMPSKLPDDYQYQFLAKFEEMNIEVEKNVSINSLLFKQKQSRGLIFYMHGNAGNLAGWGGVSRDLLPFGYDVFIYDYRGYGKSGGKISSEEQIYHDAEILLESLKKNYKEEQIILYGRSIGSGVASYLATKHKVKALILETPYYNLTWLAKHYYPFIPTFFLKYKFANNEYLKNVTSPIFLIHGTDDEVIPYINSTLLAKDFPQAKFITINGGHHNDLINFQEFREAIFVIMEKLK